jgi:NitT/TauT family transport system ATP-binding protein
MLSPPRVAQSGAALSLWGVAHQYRVRGASVPALAETNLAVRPGELLSLIGPSGCGKSTLLRIAGGLLAPTAGSVTIDGRWPADAQRDKRIGFVFQDAALLPWRTVRGNVSFGLEVNGGGRRPDRTLIDGVVRLVGLSGFEEYYPHQLSGGMRQRVALARALAPRPALLLMDEPFGALDDITRAEMREELLRIREATSVSVLFVTHSIAEAALLSDRVAVMDGPPGRIHRVIDIDLPHPRAAGAEDTPAFHDATRMLRSALRSA